jgi:hypothetical protein
VNGPILSRLIKSMLYNNLMRWVTAGFALGAVLSSIFLLLNDTFPHLLSNMPKSKEPAVYRFTLKMLPQDWQDRAETIYCRNGLSETARGDFGRSRYAYTSR